MKYAIEQAGLCIKDVPVGTVILKDGIVIAVGHNQKEELQDVTAHAEILAIKNAQNKLGSFRLKGCEMFVTLEPCPMCGWAIIQSGISKLYFGSYNSQYGAFGSVLNLPDIANSKIKVFGGIMEEECNKLLENFFKTMRK